MDIIYKNTEEYNTNTSMDPRKKHKMIFVFDDIIAGILSNTKLNQIVIELLKKSKYFSCFYYTILFCFTKKS